MQCRALDSSGVLQSYYVISLAWHITILLISPLFNIYLLLQPNPRGIHQEPLGLRKIQQVEEVEDDDDDEEDDDEDDDDDDDDEDNEEDEEDEDDEDDEEDEDDEL